MVTIPTPAPAVEAIALRKDFGEIRAVDGIDMNLPPGRIYGLLGPNGSGKTTLIRLLMGLAPATSGTVRVMGVDMPSRSNLSRIGYMTQSDGIYPELS
ncbi:MAG TPA: ATP-binding cassette domain-containing protein, partial [Candidatus Limnocylindrales bacterium]